jgi:hypothetical protein
MGEQHFADKKILSLGLRAAEEDSVNPIFAKPGNVTSNSPFFGQENNFFG